MKAVMLDWATMGPDLDISELRALLPELVLYEESTPAEVAERIADAEIVLGNKSIITEEQFAAAPKLRYIGLTATGTDVIDLAAAERHGVAVANIRAYCTSSVVEHVIGCILNLAHNLSNYAADVRGGAWEPASVFSLHGRPIRELAAMTLGIVGYGDLGQGVARAAGALGMRVIVAARPGSPEIPDDRVSFATLLTDADVISLHCPLNEATQGLFGTEEFRAMKPDAMLINTARGALVDSEALVAALADGQIAAAAVDVLPTEPPVDGNPLLDYTGDNLTVTPHIAWATREARQNAVDELTANVAAFLRGEKRNRVV